MRTRHLIFGSAAVLGILILGAMLLYFSPPVQRIIVARLVDPHPEDVFTMEYARVGLTRTEIRGFNLQRPDIGYRIESLSADLSVFDIYFRRHVILGRIAASGVEFDFTRFWEIPRPDDADPLQGLLGELDVPVMLTLDEGRVEGRLLLPGAGEEPLVASFAVTGRGLDIGATGHFEIEAFVEDPAAERWLRELEAFGEVALWQDKEGVFERLEGDVRFRALGPEAPFEEALVADATMLRTRGGEDYHGTLALEKPGATPQPLLDLDAAFSNSDRAFKGDWKAWAEAGQIAGFIYFERLPGFSGEGEGDFTYDSDTYALSLAGWFNARTDELDAFAAELRGLGGFGIATRFDLSRDNEWLRIEDLAVGVNSLHTGNLLLGVESHYPFRYHRESGNVKTPEEETPLLEIRANGAPVEWAGLLRSPEEEVQPILRRGDIFGRILVSGYEGGFLLETIEPLRAMPIDLARGGESALSGVGLELAGAASWIDGKVGVRLDPLEITVNGNRALFFDGAFSQIEQRLEGRFQADLPLLLHQPGAGFRDLAEGRLSGEFAGEFNRGLRAALLFREGRMSGAEERIPPIHLDLEALRESDSVWRFEAPLRIDREGIPTDLVLSGRTEWTEKQNRLDLQLSGGHLFLEDALELTGAFTPPEREPPPREERDETPFWQGWTGRFGADFLTLQFADGHSLETPAAVFEMRETELLASGEALFLGARAEAEASIGFNPDAERPYSLTGDLSAPDVDLGVLFQSLQPNRLPTLEGLFTFRGELRGEGIHASDLLERLGGQLHVGGEGGIFRLFYTENPLVGLGLGLAGLVGILGGELGTILEIADELGHIRYDRIELRVEREEELNIRLHDLAVLSPEFHLRGEGVIRHREETTLLNHPIDLELELAARGHLEELLGRAAVLSGERDELGYRRMINSFSIEGSLADPDVAPFYSVVAQAILGLTLPLPGRAAAEERRAAPPRKSEYGVPGREPENRKP